MGQGLTAMAGQTVKPLIYSTRQAREAFGGCSSESLHDLRRARRIKAVKGKGRNGHWHWIVSSIEEYVASLEREAG